MRAVAFDLWDTLVVFPADEALVLPPEGCIFVGDGASDELAGAERFGMEAVLFVPAGDEPQWPEVREWAGRRVSSLPEVVQLC